MMKICFERCPLPPAHICQLSHLQNLIAVFFLEMSYNDQKLSKFSKLQGMEFVICANSLRPYSLSTLVLDGFLGLETFTFLGFVGSSLTGVSSMLITKSLSFGFSIRLYLSLSLFLALVIGLWACGFP